MELSEQIAQQFINGVSLGSIYALIALGYTMVYGIIKLINFAHGDIYMVGAYLGFFAVTNLGLPIVPALILAMVVTGLLGIVIEKLAYKPLRHAPRISALISAIGVSLFLEYAMMYFVSPTPRTFPPLFQDVAFSVGSLVINGQQMLILGITCFLMVVLTYIVQYTKIGKAMRAASYDTETAQLMGINADRVISFTFWIGSSLAAVAGVLVGVYYNSIAPPHGHHARHQGVRRGGARRHRHPAGRRRRRPHPRHRRGVRLGLRLLDVPRRGGLRHLDLGSPLQARGSLRQEHPRESVGAP